MKSDPKSGRDRLPGARETAPAGGLSWSARDTFAAAFGLFLGLALIKFGNPIVLDSKLEPPKSFSEFWSYAWPPRWAFWLLMIFVAVGAGLVFSKRLRWPAPRALWFLPIAWFGWQLVSAMHTVDRGLTAATLLHFAGCLACFFLGIWVLGDRRQIVWLLAGVLAAFAFCLVRAADQKLFEFPQERQILIEGERAGWTNLSPELVLELKYDNVIISTNGVDVANPVILNKYTKGRVFGTLVYPNALAGAILLLWPIALAAAFNRVRSFGSTLARRLVVVVVLGHFAPKLLRFFCPETPALAVLALLLVTVVAAYFAARFWEARTRMAVIGVALLFGITGLFWTGSKSGWLIALLLGGIWMFRLNWPARTKWALISVAIVVGLIVFGVRFQHYFATGATSVGARLDYWRAAIQVTRMHPWVGSGPGTFQRPYELLKAPKAEMARLAHNDYLEQFSDSGIPGGLSYLGWVILLMVAVTKRNPMRADPLSFSIWIGLMGWFIEGLSEFSLYVPALAWTAFTLAGCLVSLDWKSIRQGVSGSLMSASE